MKRTLTLQRLGFQPPRQTISLHTLTAKSVYPLIHSSNLLAKYRRSFQEYEGRKEFDEDHPLPVVPTKSAIASSRHEWTVWEKYLNPQLIAGHNDIKPTDQYMGRRCGYLFPQIGWVKLGSTFKYGRHYNDLRKGFAKGTWQERCVTPQWQLAPRVSPQGPDGPFVGKLRHSVVGLERIIWAIDTGRLNRNEVITLFHLVEAEVVNENEVIWPGIKLEAEKIEALKYPVFLELQAATPRAIRLIEEAGGQFVATYLSIDGIHQELKPHEYPTFLEQEMPDTTSFYEISSNPNQRGFLSQWYEEGGKYAHPQAQRRLSHYVRPPYPRDFPATYEEYERVKHHQKWHLQQPGTGTVLPWLPEYAIERHRPMKVLTDPSA